MGGAGSVIFVMGLGRWRGGRGFMRGCVLGDGDVSEWVGLLAVLFVWVFCYHLIYYDGVGGFCPFSLC